MSMLGGGQAPEPADFWGKGGLGNVWRREAFLAEELDDWRSALERPARKAAGGV